MAPAGPDTSSDGQVEGRRLLAADLAAIAAGSDEALRRFFNLTSAKVFGLLLRMLRDHAAAEDVLQEVYFTVWRRAASFDPSRASPITWVVTIARNRAIDRLRSVSQTARVVPIDGIDIADASEPPGGALEATDRHSNVQACLATLDEPSQTAIRGAFFEGLTYEHLAARHQVPLGTMKSRIRRGLIRLRKCLGDD
jgi:RNA polymerase sigma-70 factor (ECF subfamily)